MKTIKRITEDIIEIIEEKTTTQVTQYNRNVLKKEKEDLLEKVAEIDEFLAVFDTTSK